MDNSYTHNFDNLYEMDQFVERHYLLKLIQRETNNLNRSLFMNEFKQQLKIFQN